MGSSSWNRGKREHKKETVNMSTGAGVYEQEVEKYIHWSKFARYTHTEVNQQKYSNRLSQKQDHQRVMVDPMLLIFYIYDWFRLV